MIFKDKFLMNNENFQSNHEDMSYNDVSRIYKEYNINYLA